MKNSFIEEINKNLLYLDSFSFGPLRGHKIEYDYNHLDSEDPFLQRPQQTLSELFRKNIVQSLGLNNDPLAQLGQKQASGNQRFKEINQLILDIQNHSEAKKVRLLFLLQDLGLHSKVLSLIKTNQVQCKDSMWQTHVDYAQALSEFYTTIDHGQQPSDNNFIHAYEQSPENSMIRVSICFSLIIMAALYESQNVKKISHYADLLRASIEGVEPQLSDFSNQLLLSRCYRATAFVPMHEKNYPKMIEEMNQAEALASQLQAQSKEEIFLKQENWIPVLESRTKEAILIEDFDLALSRTLRGIDNDPLDSRMRLELGQVHFHNADYEAAYEAYTQAIRLGPPGLSVSLYMAGRCLEGLRKIDRAADYYLQALSADPLQISSVERLLDLAPRLKDASFLPWLKEKKKWLDQLNI